MSKTFKTYRKIKFHEADPAGIVFFANILTIAHETFELFIQDTGLSWKDWFQPKDYYVPIRHIECDYKIPFLAGQEYAITAAVSRIGETSFQMRYVFSQNSNTYAEVKMVHSLIDPVHKQKMQIPESLKKRLSPYYTKENPQ